MCGRAKASSWRFNIPSKSRRSNAQFCVCLQRKAKAYWPEELAPEFKDLAEGKKMAKIVEMEASFMTRSVNEAFPGREKTQRDPADGVLDPKLSVLMKRIPVWTSTR